MAKNTRRAAANPTVIYLAAESLASFDVMYVIRLNVDCPTEVRRNGMIDVVGDVLLANAAVDDIVESILAQKRGFAKY